MRSTIDRWLGGLGAGLILSQACTGGSGFACGEDADCTLSGVPGICVRDGLCAYPDSSCGSGWVYSQAAPGALAGDCVDFDDVPNPGTTGVSSTNSTGTSSTGVPGSGESLDSQGGVDVSEGLSTTGGDSTGDETTTGVSCSDVGEPNDMEVMATNLTGPACITMVDNVALAGPDDVDWYLFGSDTATPVIPQGGEPSCGPYDPAGVIDVLIDAPVFTCAFVTCSGAMVMCAGIEQTSSAGYVGCCNDVGVEMDYFCDEPALTAIIVQVQGGTEACTPYALALEVW